jgi:hypothetical protein
MNELEVQAYINGWDDAIKHIFTILQKLDDTTQVKKALLEDLYYKDKYYGPFSYKDNLKL